MGNVFYAKVRSGFGLQIYDAEKRRVWLLSWHTCKDSDEPVWGATEYSDGAMRFLGREWFEAADLMAVSERLEISCQELTKAVEDACLKATGRSQYKRAIHLPSIGGI